MSAELNIYEIILQLVRTNSQFQEEDLSKLLPISTVQKGFGLYNGVLPISFNPHEDYEIDPYELMVNLDDDEERIEKLTQINLDIQKYNEWTAKKSADYEETNIWYAPIKEYQMWQFVVSKAKPAEVRETYIEDMITFINNEELYKLKEQLNIDEFVIRFNRMIYEYLRIMKNEARELNGFNSEYMWFEPNKEFISWFHSKGLIINDITPLINVQKSNLFERPNKGLSPNSSWDKITIIIIPSEHSPLPHIHIISPEYNEIKTIDNFGFTEKQNIEKPNQLFDTFMKFAIAGGQITNNSSVRVDETPVSRLRNHLKSLFGIKTQPISNYTKVDGYKCAFHLQDLSQSEERYKEIQKKINQSQYRRQDALQHQEDIQIIDRTGEPTLPEY